MSEGVGLSHFSLFSGIGGIDLAAEWAGFETVGQCEFADYPTKVLEKHWPNVPRWKDIRTLTGDDFYARTGLRTVTVLSGGFPCQPFSVAGKQKGKEDDRFLWPEMLRIIRELHPHYIVGENVPGILHIAADDICKDMEQEGYEVGIFDYEAAAVGAEHRRERFFFVAYSRSGGLLEQDICPKQSGRTQIIGASENRTDRESTEVHADVANTKGKSSSTNFDGETGPTEQREPRGSGCSIGIDRWPTEPDVGGRFNGFPDWLERHIERGMNYEESQRSVETLRELWKGNVSQTIWRSIGGFDRIQKAEILFAIVRQYKKDPNQTRIFLESEKAFGGFVRSLWVREEITGSSHRSGQKKQRTGEYTDPLQVLSRLLAYDSQENWKISSWEDGIPRVYNGIANGVERLKCLGNAVVPQQVYPILQAIADIEELRGK